MDTSGYLRFTIYIAHCFFLLTVRLISHLATNGVIVVGGATEIPVERGCNFWRAQVDMILVMSLVAQ